MKSARLVFGPLIASALGLSACGGQSFSAASGTGADTPAAQSVDPAVLTAPVASCEPGFAHPNVCCATQPGEAFPCQDYPDAPFEPCGSNQQTYPDPRTCCPLTGEGACQAVDGGTPSDSGTGAESGTSACIYPCAPGYVASGGACCPVTPAQGADPACIVSPLMTACPELPVCSCPAQFVDGGASTCSCEPPAGCASPPPPECGSCPTGWQVPEGEPGLCCEQGANGTIACFSQAIPPPTAPPPAVDSGVTTSDAGAPSPGCVCSEPSCPPGESCPPVVQCECDAGASDGGAGAKDAGASTGAPCTTSSECTGPLPQYAELCPDGGVGIAYWSCVNGVCVMPPLCQ